MKIRTGFVSNSSSQSFLVRGIRVKKDIAAKAFGVDSFEKIPYKPNGLVIEDTRDYFDGAETDDCIVGIDMGDLEDGVVLEIPNTNDDEVVKKLTAAGIPVFSNNDLSTFVQYISNDNY
jgi:hypothetical protein